MRVSVHKPRHERRPEAIDDLIGRLGLNIIPDGNNFSIRDAQITRHHAWWIELNQ
jgi:hypothetical protein